VRRPLIEKRGVGRGVEALQMTLPPTYTDHRVSKAKERDKDLDYTERGKVERNVERMDTVANVEESVYGAREHKGDIEDKKVSINSQNIAGDICGGCVQEGSVYSSELKLINARIGNNVYGARVLIGKASTNKVEIVDGNVEGDVYGGFVCERGEFARLNRVNITSTTIRKDVYGSKSGNGQSNVSTVEINNGRIGGSVYGGWCGKGLACNNEVIINLGEITGDVYGGSCEDGSAMDNKVIISSARVKGVVCSSRGRRNRDAALDGCNRAASDGKVEINNSEITKDVYGGRCDGGDAYRHIVIINGGSIGGDVYGGYGSGLVRENKVTIKGSPIFSSSTVIYGGYSENPASEVFRGNTLNIETEGQVVVKGVKNFENYNFNKVVVNRASIIKVVDRVDLGRSNVVGRVEGEAKEGDRVNLIESESGVSEAKSIKLYKGGSGLVELIHERIGEEKVLSLVVLGQELTPQAEKINEVGSTGLIVVGQGIGFLADKGIEEAVGRVKGKEGIEVFGVVGGESSKYKRGIEMGIEGMKVVGGIAKRLKEGEIVVGGYIEHGKGDYRVEEVEGKGSTRYVGVGLLGRRSIGERVYADMSMGLGSVGVDFGSSGLSALTKENIGYESMSMYVGGHVGCGYKRDIGDKLNIGVVGKVLMMKEGGKEEKLTNGVPIEFEGVTSGKIRVKGRAGYKSKGSTRYVGVGYEYELLGKSRGKVEGIEMREVDLKGGRGIGEIGISSEMGAINIDLSGTGYIGVREGVQGMLKVGYGI
jgi:hypothetical protein